MIMIQNITRRAVVIRGPIVGSIIPVSQAISAALAASSSLELRVAT